MHPILLFNHCVKFAQQAIDQQVISPQILIEPADSLIQRAVEKLKATDSQFFVGVKKIVVDTNSGAFGFVASGPSQDPTVIHINLQKIRQEVQSKLGGASQEQVVNEIVRQIAIVIAHEKGHVKSYKPDQGFVGNEAPAEAAEHAMENKLK